MNKDLVKKLAELLKKRKLKNELRIMEVCGTHTAEFFRTGVKDLFPEGLTLIDGPGCPVCVTPNSFLDLAITIAKDYNVILATFGDMIKVPSSYSSLAKEKAEGMDVRIVYSPLDAIKLAADNPEREVIFLSVGFETTAPSEAIAIMEAEKQGIRNFSLLSCNKLTPPAVEALINADEVRIDGFIVPGHVSAIIGREPWDFIATKYGKPGVIAGFEAYDLITGVLSLIDLLEKNEKAVKNGYPLVVKENGNVHAKKIIQQVFDITSSVWRGIGEIPESGLKIKEQYAAYNAEQKFPATPPPVKEHPGCRCGDLLRGVITPPECPLFGKVCTPENAVGPCMVSSEGPCSAYFKYWRR
ncbi:MAG TPA: hydrogenase formation protein HypD [Spirochaetota bacterium]|nr:hydrogenase formation protein HypD [Spirochaetota bacterium]HPF07418.1 hydrogenase formation protein HypD [Spirochaetota bacterium]HPJ43903.1 hydrogenase formation protein HypD [Spirochaetota bacterium]HPR38714.1 hydrogenase formation protein HypD [Spirochaetota bacterium]HRX48730.1 hydrogenase formation protein HypD [Spirochaetota bacterium]